MTDTDLAGLSFPTAEEIARIADKPDPVMRNLWITYSYHRINRAMAAVIGDRDLCWCGFAVWASKTAGKFIRQEELDGWVEEWVARTLLRAGIVARVSAHATGIHHAAPRAGATSQGPGFTLRGFAREVLAGVAADIGGGNQDVFRNIAPPFAKLLSFWQAKGGRLSEADREEFVNSLREGNEAEQGEHLARAFTATLDGVGGPGPRARAQAMLYANALIGYVEQRRVQPFIEKSMNTPVADLFADRLSSHLHGRFAHWLARLLHALLRPIGRALEAEFRHLSTEWMMCLRIPERNLRLGENVPPLPDGRPYPEDLTALDSPQPCELCEQLHATDEARSAAADWMSFEQRMRYIGVLFRSRQQERSMWEPPFTEQQVARLEKGELPSGPL